MQLQNSPEARNWTIAKLVRACRDGKIRIPQFQRGLRWDSGDVRELFDSIKRGYPIGTLLLWKRSTPAPAGTVKFGSLDFVAEQQSDAFWVVDGQQRTTALVAALLHAAPDFHKPPDNYEFYYDLESETFVRRSARQLPPNTWLPLWIAFDNQDLNPWIRAANIDLELQKQADAIATRIQQYEIPSVIVESEDDRVLREIFRRTNNAGRRLNQNEIFHALYTSHPSEHPNSLKNLAESLVDLQFGDMSALPYRQIVLALRDIEPTKGVQHLEVDDPRFAGAIGETRAALRQAIVFLKRDAGVPIAQLVPYSTFFTLLARYFHFFPEPNRRSRELLSRWFWRAWISGQFRGDVGKIRSAFKAIAADEEEQSVQRLLKLLPKAEVKIEAAFDLRTASGKILALTLLERKPLDLQTGGDIELPSTSSDSADIKHFFVRIARATVDASLIGNVLVAPGLSPSACHRLLKRSLANGDERVLESHFFDTGAKLDPSDLPATLADRTKRILACATRLVETRARTKETDRPSLNYLASIDED